MAYTQYPAGTVLQHESGTITTVEGGTSTAYDTSKWSPVSTPSTGGGTTGGSSFVPTGSTQQEQAASVLAEIQRIQAELTTKQGQLANAQTAGITSGTIPDWVLSGSEMPAGFVWPEDTVLSASSPYKATSEIEALKKQLEQSALLKQQQYDAAMKEYQTQQKSWLEKLTSQPTVTETRAQLAEKYGITEKEQELEAGVAALEAKQKAYNDAVAQKELALSAERERLAPMEFIAARMTRIERDANIRLNQMAADINVDVAMMEFKAGRLDKAYEFINQAVSDYTADLQWQYQYTTDFMEMNYQLIQDLKSDQQDVLNKVWQLQLLQLEQTQQEKTNIGNLMLQYPTAGIQMSDTMEQATQKASSWAVAHPEMGELEMYEAKLKLQQQYEGGGVTVGKWDNLVTQLISGNYDPKTQELNIDGINATLEGFSQADKTAIKNAIYEKIYQLENTPPGGGVIQPLPQWKEVPTGGTSQTQIQDPFVQWLMGEAPMGTIPTGGFNLPLTISETGGKIVPK